MKRFVVALGLVLVGCGSAPTVGVRPTDPPLPRLEAGVVRADEVLRGKGGVQLYARSYRPESGEPKAVVVFQHGLKDHGDHYAPFSQRLVQRGYAAYAMDMRGHGRSAGERAAIDHFDDYVEDLAMYVEHVRAKEPGKPIFVFGHSAGGVIVTSWVVERRPQIAGVMLSAAALENDAAPGQIAAVCLTEMVNSSAPVFDLPNDRFSRDPAVSAQMTADPLIYQEAHTVHLASEILDALHRIWDRPEAFQAPLLAMHGTGDQITAPSGTRNLVRLAGSKDKTLRLYEGYAHVLLQEPGYERVESDMVGWLEAHTAADPSAARPPVSDLDAPIARELRGDRSGHTATFELDVRGERGLSPYDTFGADFGLRYRHAFGKVGYVLGFEGRIGGLSGFRWLADAHLLGFGARAGTFQFALTGGLGGRGFDSTNVLRTPIEIIVESGAGPVRLLARGGVAWKLTSGGPGTSALGFADEATALLGARLGRDRRYWQDVHAGGGPFLGLTYTRLGSVDFFGVALGLELWGAN